MSRRPSRVPPPRPPSSNKASTNSSSPPPQKPASATASAKPSSSSSTQPLTFRSRTAPKPVEPPVSPQRIIRYRKPLLLATGIVGALISFRIAFAYTAYKRDAAHYAALETPVPADVSSRYRNVRLADRYDSDVDTMEWLMGISRLREKLVAQAQGHVLEASVGTGRNAAYYPLTKGITTITMVDASKEMLDIARAKWTRTNPWFINALFRHQSAAEEVPLPNRALGRGGFDTVVQTMGVCSTAEPERALANFGRLCRPDGRILLLEHGRGHYDWLNRWIDTIAPAHADREGCWFNKDVGEIVRRSGLEVVEEKRFHFGTTWWFVLKPPAPTIGDDTQPASEQRDPARPWWSSWWK